VGFASLTRGFLERATGHEPSNLVTSNEVRQMRRLNKDKLHGSDRIYAGERLSLAPTYWDVPDGRAATPATSTSVYLQGVTACMASRRWADQTAPGRTL
jgi:hypothetical protein